MNVNQLIYQTVILICNISFYAQKDTPDIKQPTILFVI